MNPLAERLREKAVDFDGTSDVPSELLRNAATADFVLIGEASHGTHEFYKFRAEITKRLMTDYGFAAVAVEADFPDAYRVNRYVRGTGPDQTANDALSSFERFPLWMWRNADVLDFVGWLRDRNEGLPVAAKAGLYGLDLYSLHSSMPAVLDYLEKVDPEAAKQARYRYSCFDRHGEDPQAYGYAANYDLDDSCQKEVVTQLIDLRRKAADYMSRDGFVARDEFFFAEQNARLVKNAEEYYREMFRGPVSSWNLRDCHMTDTLFALADHLKGQNIPPKIVVWAHNSHLGDARATEMGASGEWNVGQLVRQRAEGRTYLIGFTTYIGTVTAAANWDEPAQLKRVNPGLKDSIELLFHGVEKPRFWLDLRDREVIELLARPRLERAIGVIYRPETERLSHYFEAHLTMQFDAVIHFDHTRAVEPLDRTPGWKHDDLPETFPAGV
jgi:erythromycin esterase-like protein